MPTFREVFERHFRFNGEQDILPFLVKGRRKHQDGRTLLAQVLRDMDARVGAEIGTRFGVSAKLWCETIPGLKLTCIDPYAVYHARRSQEKQDAVYEAAKQTLAPFDVTFRRASSRDVVDEFADGSLDFINIDGDHTFDAAVLDLIQYVPKVRDGGLVLVHDYFSFWLGGVVAAVNGYAQCHLIKPWFVTHDLEPTAFWERGAEQA